MPRNPTRSLLIALGIWLGTAILMTGETRLEAEEVAKKKATVEKTAAQEEAKRSATVEKAAELEATKREAREEAKKEVIPKTEPKTAEEAGKELSKAAPAEKKETAAQETRKEKATAKEEATMADESTTKDSLPDEEAIADTHEDCGLEFAEKKADGEKASKRGDLAIYSGFDLKFKDEISPFSLMTTSVLPGEEFTIEVSKAKEGDVMTATCDEGTVTKISNRKWKWKAPLEPGPYCVKISREGTADTACLQAFVLVKYNGEDNLSGYPIGAYPDSTTKTKDPVKMRPEGFIEVTKANRDTWVSPHFQLKQFLCKGYDDYPQYVIIRTRLLLKLEALLEDCRNAGIKADSLYVMSGFRTPAYNTKIGNKTTLSRHTFGDAADVYVDEDRDGMIDDLNKDGKSDTEDARLMHELVVKASKEGWRKPLAGGLSLYPANASRSAFIHVDARGVDIHWDNL